MQAEKKQSWLAIWLSLISNLLLTFIKIIIGVTFKSQVLIADGIHNAGDVIASAAAFGAMRISNQPADDDHPYGHGKAEVLGASFVAVILALAAIWTGYHSVAALLGPAPEAHWLALVAAVVSLVWKQGLYLYTLRIGKSVNSKSLLATAYDHLADVYASLAAVIGIGLALIGEAYELPYLVYGDPAAGIIVSILVMKLAVDMGREAVDVLMEKNVKQEQIERYTSLIQAIPEVKRIDRLRAREHGHYVLVDLRVSIPGEMSIQEGHDVSRKIKRAVMDADSQVDEVLIHINPWYNE
ncbi:cation diffusion facilitator family transporter [Paenibacillus koleovorans]|uniref:cation diffusion facilitator family transporter n=1 Tax=Paenibacillus koleovorans TaxID=121608 RepID=UPI000FDB2094|nr:cation diffusion facilitator family transporter [Paenibacillus koleovorans]